MKYQILLHRLSVPRFVSIGITVAQISQMLVGILVNLLTWHAKQVSTTATADYIITVKLRKSL